MGRGQSIKLVGGVFQHKALSGTQGAVHHKGPEAQLCYTSEMALGRVAKATAHRKEESCLNCVVNGLRGVDMLEWVCYTIWKIHQLTSLLRGTWMTL